MTSGPTFDVHSPADGRIVGRVPDRSAEEVAAAVGDLRTAQPAWDAIGVAERACWLRRYRDWLLDNEDALARLLQAETAKPWAEATIELPYVVDVINYYCAHAGKFLASSAPGPHGPLTLTKSQRLAYRPYPVVGVITPWNFPLALALVDAVPALLAGASVAVKPSEFTPLTTEAAVRGWAEIGAPEIFTCLTGSGTAGAAIADTVDFVQFTGSSRTGKVIGQRAGERLIPYGLELGGKDPMIVLAEADLARAANGAVWGSMCNAGQMCTSVERVYVEAPVYEQFVALVVERVRALRVGADDQRYRFDVGALANDNQVSIVDQQVQEAVERGAKPLTGGRRGETGTFFEPTVLVDVDHSMACMTEETFGPVLSIMKVPDAEEAIRLANDTPYGLSASVWSTDTVRAKGVARSLEAGAVNINDVFANLFALPVPQAGWKQSGIGSRLGGTHGIRKYCRPQVIVSARIAPTNEPQWYPYTPTKGKLVRRLVRLLGARGLRRRLTGSRPKAVRSPKSLLIMVCVLATVLTPLIPPTAWAQPRPVVDPAAEAANVAFGQTRLLEYRNPEFQRGFAEQIAEYQRHRLAIRTSDPERQPDPNFCTSGLCVTDPRLMHWADGQGRVQHVLFTARNGATLSGHLWMSGHAPRPRPAVVIINGSIAGYEQAYWWAAQALAKSGYLVFTFDPQGEGVSDAFGEAPDTVEGAGAGTPPLGDGLPFYDGVVDALDFLFSTPARPYVPRPSRGTGTSHADKQDRRVRAGLNTGYNPWWRRLDRERVGIAGHSYGAQAASWIGQDDPRIKAIVAWDDLCTPTAPSPPETQAFLGASLEEYLAGTIATTVPVRFPRKCFGAPPGPAPKLSKPALGLNGDYGLNPAPYATAADPEARSEASVDLTRAGVDTGDIAIRGGTHAEWSLLPYSATLRGIDMSAWYTIAWFDKYLKDDPTADRRLLTNRWAHDTAGAAVDLRHDPNLFSYHYRSRLDVTVRGGEQFRCENLRAGCVGQTTAATDCGPPTYSAIALATGRIGPVSCRRRAGRRRGCCRSTGGTRG